MEAPKRNTIDPSLNPDHLTSKGKRKGWKVKKDEQQTRLDNLIQDQANDLMPDTTVEKKPVEEKHYWWDEKDE